MRWTCPHCQSKIGLNEEQLGSNWSFVQCQPCQGYSLIRKAEVNCLRLDKIPQGERILKADTQITPPPFHRAASVAKAESSPDAATLANANSGSNASPVGESAAQAVAKQPSTSGWNFQRVALGITAVLALYSGISLVKHGRRLIEQTNLIETELARGSQQLAQAPIVSDAVSTAAMAPNRSRAVAPAPTQLQINVRNAILRSGPGQENAVVGTAAQHELFTVAETRDNWTRVNLPPNGAYSASSAWIRNDLVKVLSR